MTVRELCSRWIKSGSTVDTGVSICSGVASCKRCNIETADDVRKGYYHSGY